MTNDSNDSSKNHHPNQRKNSKDLDNHQIPKIRPILQKTQGQIVQFSTFQDPQGIDWTGWPRGNRSYYESHIDQQIKPYFCVLTSAPVYDPYSMEILFKKGSLIKPT